MKELLASERIPSAVFTFNDMLAFGAMRAVRERGLTVPGDIALVGYDDVPMAEYACPPLTTIRQPVREICEKGIETLLEILDGDHPEDFYERTVLAPELIVRQSCGRQREPT
jgi:DNA-binding LacI/PurR family transcriptional regulator